MRSARPGGRRHVVGTIGSVGVELVDRTGHIVVKVDHWSSAPRSDVFVFTSPESALLFGSTLAQAAKFASNTDNRNDTP